MDYPAQFVPIDRETWPMAQSFYYYTQMAPTSYSVTVQLNITKMHDALRARGLKFFPVYLYLVTRAVGAVPQLRVAVQQGVLGHWSQLTPAYPQFHPDTETTSLLWTAWQPQFAAFYAAYLADTAAYGGDTGILTQKGAPPPNAFIVSCIPWVSFTSFSLHNHGLHDYYVPSVEAGRWQWQGEQLLLPLSVTVHHATTDGWHLHRFFDTLQQLADEPESWID